MIDYILRRLRTDSEHIVALSKNESAIGHPGVKGRLREILVNNLLIPWLPLGIKCGTGIIIDSENQIAKAGQEDIILYDELLAPQVLSSPTTPDGVFIVNSVLCRIEVKSKVTRNEMIDFIKKSINIAGLKYNVREKINRNITGPLNMLFAYESDCVSIENEYDRLLDLFKECNCSLNSGIVSMICIPNLGYIKLNRIDNKNIWQKLQTNDSRDYIAYFVATVSSSCFNARMERQNRDVSQSLEGGIGMYLDSPYINIR